jgi:nucleoside phosphorylase
VRLGRITSGDQFGIPQQRIEDILRQLKPDLMEMESGSVAQVCWYLRTPFICIRSGSNRTQNSPDNDYRKLSPFASRQAALFTVSLLKELGRRKAKR